MNGHGAKNGERSLAPYTPVEGERYIFESQVRDSYGRCAYAHKTQEKMAERNARWLHGFKWVQIILAAITTAGAIGAVFAKDTPMFAYGTAVVSVLLLIANAYVKDVDPGQAAQKHRDAATDIWNVRESYLSLLTDIRDPNFSFAELRTRRDELQNQLYKIYKAAPQTDLPAYSEAQDALQKKEDLTFSEDEIDALLPTSLRRGQQ
jgi:SMODS and SLOG-associating 2TM effector domain family 4